MSVKIHDDPAARRSSSSAAAAGSLVRSGIGPLDERLGGLRPGGTYIMAGLPGSGRFVALLQFLNAGLEEEGRVGLVTAAPRRRVFEEARHWGFDLEGAWEAGRVGLLSYKADFQRQLLSAAEPRDVFDEMGRLLGGDIRRLALYPATPLWETRAGTAVASHVIDWLDRFGATTLGAVGGDLEGDRTPASDWVLDAASGVFLMERDAAGLRQLWVRRMSPPTEEPGPITLELTPGAGYTGPSGRLDRRRTDRSAGNPDRVLMIRLADRIPPELASWLDRWYSTTTVAAPFAAVERVQDDGFGLVLVYLSRERVGEAIQAVRALRGVASAPILLVTTDRVRAEDRIRALEAGASDFLSDPLSVGELASRAEKAMIAGAPATDRRGEVDGAGRDESATPHGGHADGEGFTRAVEERMASPRRSLFTFVRFSGPERFEDRQRLRAILLDEIRDEDGDLAGEVPGGLGVLLHGTEVAQAEAFLARVRGRLGSEGGANEPEVMSGTLDRGRIREALRMGRS
jgi:CheY-like chemotaxis protein